MAELIAVAFSLLIGGAFAALLGNRLPVAERKWVWLGLVAHILGSTAKVLIVFYYYKDGDMDSYIRDAQYITRLIRMDPGEWLMPYLQLGLHGEPRVPYLPPGQTGSTRTIFVFTALHQLLFGVTRFGISYFVGVLSFASKVGLYMAFREHYPERFRTRIAIACLLIPSAVFWSSSLSKEGLLWITCGWIPFGFHLFFFKKARAKGLLIMVAASYWCALLKTYVLIPMVLGFAVWLYLHAARNRKRPARTPLRSLAIATLAFGIAIAAIIGIGKVFPRYDVMNFATEAENLRDNATVDSGSYYSIGGSGFAGQLTAAPLAALTAMYRPLIIEASNPLMLANALETTLLLLLTFYILRERGLRIVTILRSSPAAMYCLIYVAVFSAAVGLTSTNLGTLSRYRMPMMPYFGMLFAVLVPLLPQAAPRRVRARRRRGRVTDLHPPAAARDRGEAGA